MTNNGLTVTIKGACVLVPAHDWRAACFVFPRHLMKYSDSSAQAQRSEVRPDVVLMPHVPLFVEGESLNADSSDLTYPRYLVIPMHRTRAVLRVESAPVGVTPVHDSELERAIGQGTLDDYHASKGPRATLDYSVTSEKLGVDDDPTIASETPGPQVDCQLLLTGCELTAGCPDPLLWNYPMPESVVRHTMANEFVCEFPTAGNVVLELSDLDAPSKDPVLVPVSGRELTFVSGDFINPLAWDGPIAYRSAQQGSIGPDEDFLWQWELLPEGERTRLRVAAEGSDQLLVPAPVVEEPEAFFGQNNNCGNRTARPSGEATDLAARTLER